MKYYDCHSHHNSTRPNHIAIRSIDLKIDGELSTKLDSPFTIGIHPWSSESCRTEDLKKVKELLGHSNCFGLGEIGLDKIKGAPLENQIEIMEQQLKMAWEANISTVVLHCVRSFNEIFPLVKNHSKDFRFIFHDFQSPAPVYRQFSEFNCFFSVSPRIFRRPVKKVYQRLSAISLDQILIETDDAKSAIETHYHDLIQVLEVPRTEFIEKIECNFLRAFPKFQPDPVNR